MSVFTALVQLVFVFVSTILCMATAGFICPLAGLV